MDFRGFAPAFNASTATDASLMKNRDTRNQMQGQNILAEVLRQYAASQDAPPPLAPGAAGGLAFTNPGTPATGGVSPPAPALPPPGGAPGGMAGPSSSMSGAPLPGGIDLNKLIQSAGGASSNGAAQSYALQSALKMLQPQANNAVKLDLGQLRSNTQEDIADKNNASRKSIADANNKFKMPASEKPLNDPKFRKLEITYNNAVKAYAANPTDDNYKAQIDAANAYNNYAPAGKATTSSAPKMVEVISPDGTSGTIPSDQLSDALTQGYKQK